jgi:PAS domain S-box-containing protein
MIMTSGRARRAGQPFNFTRFWREAGWLALVAIAYWIAVRIGHLFVVQPEGLASVWPASGLALAALLLSERRRWARLLLVIFITDMAGELVGGNQLPASFGFALADTLGPAVSAWLIIYFSGPHITFTNLKEALTLCGVAVLSSGVTALLGAAVPTLVFGASYWDVWLVWWVANVLGIMLITPIIVTSAARPSVLRATPPRRLVEWVLLLAALSALAALIYGPFTEPDRPLLQSYVLFPLLVWAGLRHSPRGAMLMLLPLAAIAIWGTAQGYGVFAPASLTLKDRLLLLQSFLSVTAFSEIVLATVVAERRQAAQTATEREHNLRLQRDLSVALNTTGDLADALSRVLEAARQVEGVDCGGVYLLDNPSGNLKLVAHTGLSAQFVKQTSHFAADAPQTRLTMPGEPVYRRHSEIAPQMNGARQHEGLRAGAVIPVKHEGQVIAVLNLASHAHEEIPINSRDALETIAAQVGGVVARIRAESQKEAALEALRRRERDFSSLVEHATDMIVRFDADLRHVYCNPAVERQFGIPMHTFLGKTPLEAAEPQPSEQAKFVDRSLRKVLETRAEQQVEQSYKVPSGVKYFQTRIVPEFDANGRIESLLAVTRDITERRQAEEALQASEKRFRALVENSADAIAMISADGAVIYEAPNVPRITGYTTEERLGKSGFETVLAEDWPIVQTAFAQLVASPGSVAQNIQFRAIRKDGAIWWAEATATNLLHDPSVRAIVINYRDITDRKQAESQKEAALKALRENMERLKMTQAQLVQAAKLAAVGELAAGVAHELNNPLTSVLGYAELLLRSLPPDTPFRGDLEIIDKQAIRARDIVRNLLDFARQSKPERRPSDLNQVVQQTLGLIRQHLETSGVVIEEQYAPHLEPITLNSGQIKQVFLNLINNAAQAMPYGGRLCVSTGRVGDEILVTVADTGSGIPPDIMDRIFDPFFTTKPVGQGTGLGLSVSLGIVQDHGGRITVESRLKPPDPDGRPGGSTFSVWLPVKEKPV